MKASYRVGRALAKLVLIVLGTKWTGAERVPARGALVIAPNHRSYLDPPLVGCGAGRELFFFAKKELFGVPVLGYVIRHVFNAIPIRRGSVDRRAIATAIDAVRGGGALVLFPEGTRAAPGGYLPPKLGAAMVAAKAGAEVVPVHIEGTGRGALGLIRSALRLERIRVTYGDPIRLEAVGSEGAAAGYQAGAERIMDAIRALAERDARDETQPKR